MLGLLHRRAARHIHNLGVALVVAMLIAGVLIVGVAVMTCPILGDQAGALDAAIVFAEHGL